MSQSVFTKTDLGLYGVHTKGLVSRTNLPDPCPPDRRRLPPFVGRIIKTVVIPSVFLCRPSYVVLPYLRRINVAYGTLKWTQIRKDTSLGRVI